MRYKGQQLKGPKIETLVIPRDDKDIVFQARAVMDFSDYTNRFPMPEPPEKIAPGGKRSKVTDDPQFQENLKKWLEQKQAWMILKSLEASIDVQWDTVNMDDPTTFGNYWDELAEAGFNDMERLLIRNLALKANSVDEEKMEEARERFFKSQAAQQASS